MNNIGSSSILVSEILNVIFNYQPRKKEVVVVGYGWAGKSFCDKIDKNLYNVTVISKSDYMLNTTKLKNSINNDNDKLLIKPNYEKIKFIKDSCNEINEKDKLIISGKKKIEFDYLVIATGSTTNDFNIKGVKENCYFLKELSDLYKLKDAFHKKDDQQIVVLGGGPNGLELAFELSKTNKQIKIIEAMTDILPTFTEETRRIVKNELKNNGINLILNNKVNKIEKNMIHSKENNLDKMFFFDTSIWTCGIKPNSILKEKIIVDKNLKFKNDIFFINASRGEIVSLSDLAGNIEKGKVQGACLDVLENEKLQKFSEEQKIALKAWTEII